MAISDNDDRLQVADLGHCSYYHMHQPPMKKWIFIFVPLALLFTGILAEYNLQTRHYLFRVVTKLEYVMTSFGSDTSSRARSSANVPYYIHRGRSQVSALNNSLLALRQTAKHFRRIEIDIAFSKDLVPYVSHGDDLFAQTGKALDQVDSYDAATLDTLVLRDGQKLMSFKRFLNQFSAEFDSIILDVKTSGQQASNKASILHQLLPTDDEEKFIVISPSGSFLLWFKKMRPSISVACETYLAIANWAAGFEMISISFTEINTARDWFIGVFNLERLYWTANSEQQLDTLLSWHPTHVIVGLQSVDSSLVPTAWRKNDY